MQQIEFGPGLLIVFYEENGKKWVEIASNYNLTCPFTPEIQRGRGNVFMPLEKFREIMAHAQLQKALEQCSIRASSTHFARRSTTLQRGLRSTSSCSCSA
jgi:hypothetical protein